MNTSLRAKKSVLLVDDESDLREILANFIKESLPEVRVVEAVNGAEAMTKMRFEQFDLVITDMKMPKMDGHTLIQNIMNLAQAQRPGAIFVVSGNMDPIQGPKELGPISFIPKPVHEADFILQVKKHLGLLSNAAPPSSGQIDVNFINPFIDATIGVLSTLSNTSCERESLFIRKNDQISGDISALVTMNSNSFLGSMALAFDESCFLGVISGMFGEKVTSITAENQDAASEICNQIFGMAKRALNEMGHAIQPAIPSVIVGKGHTIKHSVQGLCIAVRFNTPSGKLTIEAVTQKIKR